MSEYLLAVQDLVSAFQTSEGWLRAVDKVSFNLKEGETLGIVGESGCGKSVTAMSLIDLLPKPVGQVLGGDIYFKGQQLRGAKPKALREVRGGEIGVIFQEPMSALNPLHRIGRQMVEGLRRHKKMSKRAALERCVSLLEQVGIPHPEVRINDYPHQLSGGMRQRVMIAMAISTDPALLIADEPTTALDVTVQAQILQLLADLQQRHGMAMIMITHDLGVIAETCDNVLVMYGGRVVEKAPVTTIFEQPRHAYTKGLLAALPRLTTTPKTPLNTIPGQVASLQDFVYGCRFCQRLGRTGKLVQERPDIIQLTPTHWVENCPSCIA